MPASWCSLAAAVPVAAAVVDYAIADPWNWIHPVQVMGSVIQRYQAIALARLKAPIGQRWAGAGLGIGLPVLSGLIAIAIVELGQRIHPVAGMIVAIVMMASCFAGRSLRRAADDVLRPVARGDLPAARRCLSLYVGRDTEHLPETEILRAVMETVSENATDGVFAPVFYALIGTAISPAVGVGAAMAYKALSTLDSMIGYRSPPYIYLGWVSARCEDVVTWLPCRLTVLTIALLSRRPCHVWRVCQRDAPADPSPNAGWSECAYAAALGVQLGGINRYRGEIRKKPLLGDAIRPITAAIIQQAMGLTRSAVVLWLILGTLGLSLRYHLTCG